MKVTNTKRTAVIYSYIFLPIQLSILASFYYRPYNIGNLTNILLNV